MTDKITFPENLKGKLAALIRARQDVDNRISLLLEGFLAGKDVEAEGWALAENGSGLVKASNGQATDAAPAVEAEG